MIRASMTDSIGERTISIIDISSRGLLATCPQPPKRGDFVSVQLGRRGVAGHVRWAGRERFGLVLQDRIDVNAVLSGQDLVKLRRQRAAPVAQKKSLWDRLRENLS